jgi:hypothetical protein
MLPNPTPITTDPVPARVFDRLHVLSLTANAPSASSGVLTVELIPSTQDGVLAPMNLAQRISCPLYPTLDEVPELRAAFDAVVGAIPATQAYLAQMVESGATDLQQP